ncbi:hypothetical protein N5863_29575 (plasmid) [Klebsiella pasteurii]|uniref:hypothetical protein n=1 Tax=Klebsiella pasteurii TaxID=2587529 RepID=UPI00254375F6|nr:hypothetical protein [Klebsiella pasteurii]WII85215.1 hypothetical protein N5863_29575 [Klebsiella pasteurii]
MTDITRLINSIKRRTSSARELGYDVLFVKLDDLDVLAESLETALRANAAQADHIEQLQDSFNKLAAENGALKQFPEQIVKFIGGLGTSEIGSDTKEKIELAASQQAANFTAYLQKEGLISAADCLRDSDPLDTESEDRRG